MGFSLAVREGGICVSIPQGHTFVTIKRKLARNRFLPTRSILCNVCGSIRPGLGAVMHLDTHGCSIIVCAQCAPGHAKLNSAWKQAIQERHLQKRPLPVPAPISDWTPCKERRG